MEGGLRRQELKQNSFVHLTIDNFKVGLPEFATSIIATVVDGEHS